MTRYCLPEKASWFDLAGGDGIKVRSHQNARQFCHRCGLRLKQFAVPSINVGTNGPVVTQKPAEAISGDIKTVPDLTAL